MAIWSTSANDEGFNSRLHEICFKTNLDYDNKLLPWDIIALISHGRMLAKCELISASDAELIETHLQEMKQEALDGTLKMLPEIEDCHSLIEDELIKFNVVDNINDADIVIVFGHNNFQSIFGGDVNDNWLGQAVTINEEEYEQEYNDDNIVNPDICSIVEGRIWVDTYDELLIKHEFLHVLGFIHTNKNNSIMNHYTSQMSNLKDIDEKAIYLKYNNDLVQEVIAVPGGTGFPDWLFTNEEYEIHLDNVRLTLENRFNL